MNRFTTDIEYQALTILGWETGIVAPYGVSVIENSVFQNVRDIVVRELEKNRKRELRIQGNNEFLNLSDAMLNGREREFVSIEFDLTWGIKINPGRLFVPDLFNFGTVLFKGAQIYMPEQAPDYIPYPRDTTADVPPEFLGLTNAKLWARYGLAVGGVPSPSDLMWRSAIGRWTAAVPNPYPVVKLLSQRHPETNQPYQLTYRIFREDGSEETVTLLNPIQLRPGWNVFTFMIDGHPRSVLVFRTS